MMSALRIFLWKTARCISHKVKFAVSQALGIHQIISHRLTSFLGGSRGVLVHKCALWLGLPSLADPALTMVPISPAPWAVGGSAGGRALNLPPSLALRYSCAERDHSGR